ncbi:MAG TPA: DNA polymerase III subunit gamma/tau [Elusimicrobia bacterium]|nr:MAG: DNA polymerase III, subunit gamma and tau [Elusimicrobia bacterium GWA2_64_40]OGR63830.1 MAG: DNA polymerase III, subunit gamma and tau [Elusimicrobia bacterium GWB2_63_16]HAN04894.1 DNA polymerase III subunit gamma/tau [Elusimicrobiota bacterium]HAU89519.1 DNA polymerase III subunit gamma/tau [Elusimicrobiota bacterium]
MYENLATKYRPGDLTEVMGQETIKTTLQNAVKLGRVAHSYVFYGQRGCGKTTIARILARTLNCHKPKDGVPCGKCPSCTEIAESKSLDVIEIDAASNTQVDKVRSVIVDQASFAPSRDKYKIYILDEVHMLSTGAFNALLKTVEEPPAHVVFIMATTEQNKVPVTILSRSQCFRFRPISDADIIARLKTVTAAEKMKAEPEALRLIARSSGGALRDALTMLDRAASFGHGEIKADLINELLGYPGGESVNAMALSLVNRDAAALHAAFDRLNAEGYDALASLRELRNNFAEAFLAAQGFNEGEPIKNLPKGVSPALLARLSRKLNIIVEEVKFSDSPALSAEIALFTLIETPQDLEALVRRLEALETGAASGAPVQPAPASAQKKNDFVTPPAPAAASPAPAQAAAEAPAAAPAGQRSGADAWKRLLGQASSRKPALYNILLSVKIVFAEENKWRLLSGNKFETSMIETARAELEEMLEKFAGRRIALVPEFAQAPAQGAQEFSAPEDTGSEEPTMADLSDEEASQDAPPAPKSPHAPRQVVAGTEPELKHLAKVFHGRITRIDKVK